MMKLFNGDCLEIMKEFPCGSVDLILTDPPYGTIKNLKIDGYKNKTTEWDTAINPIDIFKEASRILRQNGKCILFSQEPYTSKLITEAISLMPFCYRAVWVKNVHANYLGCKSSMVNLFEDICIFQKIYDDYNTNELRDYFQKILEFIGVKSCNDINKKLGHRRAEHSSYVTPIKKHIKNKIGQKADHCFRTGSTQFSLCTEKTYQELIKVYKINKMDGFIDYAGLKKINKKYESVFNLWQGGKSKSNVLEYSKDTEGFHPTQKPILLLEDLIKTFSNEGDTVLDFCAGSMSTAIACINTNRDFIGIELDENYFNVGKQRIDNHKL